MKILAIGDIVGEIGLNKLKKELPQIINDEKIDFVVVNAENTSGGMGLTIKDFNTLLKMPIDAITMGNHTWDKKDIIDIFKTENALIRPLNYPEGTVGLGFNIYPLSDGRKIAVAQLLGQVFMRDVNDPFQAIEQITQKYTLGKDYNALIIDYDRVTDAETLYDEIYEKLKEVEFFTKKGEGQLIIISYDSYNPKIWSQVRAIVQKENLVEMKKFLYLKDNHQGIRDAYVFWLK